MFRKLIFALGASAVIGAAALTPTAASAHGPGHHGHGHHGHHGHRHHFHRHWHGGFYPVYGAYGGGCYYVKKFVPTPYGVVPKRVLVCG